VNRLDLFVCKEGNLARKSHGLLAKGRPSWHNWVSQQQL